MNPPADAPLSDRKACVIGWPVSHSRSPVIHRYWLSEHGIEGDYVRMPVAPDRIEEFLTDFATSGYVGCNVTVPHKEIAFALVPNKEPSALETGSLNTIWLEDGVLHGMSTDGFGFVANLDQQAPGWDRTPGAAVVLGAGGAARPIVWALRARGIERIHVVNRTVGRAEALAAHFGETVRPAGWDSLPGLLSETSLLVNTTSLGMVGQPALEIDLDGLPETAVVDDIVYTPLETALLASARKRGNRIVDGLGMLLHQAVPGFEKWFGQRPEVTPALRQIVLDAMAEG